MANSGSDCEDSGVVVASRLTDNPKTVLLSLPHDAGLGFLLPSLKSHQPNRSTPVMSTPDERSNTVTPSASPAGLPPRPIQQAGCDAGHQEQAERLVVWQRDGGKYRQGLPARRSPRRRGGRATSRQAPDRRRGVPVEQLGGVFPPSPWVDVGDADGPRQEPADPLPEILFLAVVARAGEPLGDLPGATQKERGQVGQLDQRHLA